MTNENISTLERYINRETVGTASDQVLSTILEGLVNGSYKPGQKVNARQLSEDLQVSIVPVREALHILAGEGVIDLLPMKGARIRSMNPEEVANWWQIFGGLAVVGVRGAAEKIDQGDNRAQIIERMDAIRNSAGKVTPLEFIFYLADLHSVFNIIANPQINEAIRRLSFSFWAIFLPDFVPVEDCWDEYVANHQRMVDAVLAGDADGAAAIYHYHISWLESLILGGKAG